MPVTMTRPRHSSSRWIACSNRSSRRSTSARMAAASVCRTFFASAMSMADTFIACLAEARAREGGACLAEARMREGGSRSHSDRGFLCDGVNLLQLANERLQVFEAQRIGRVAFRPRRLLVHLHEHRID